MAIPQCGMCYIPCQTQTLTLPPTCRGANPTPCACGWRARTSSGAPRSRGSHTHFSTPWLPKEYKNPFGAAIFTCLPLYLYTCIPVYLYTCLPIKICISIFVLPADHPRTTATEYRRLYRSFHLYILLPL